jgi:hypothetical protein
MRKSLLFLVAMLFFNALATAQNENPVIRNSPQAILPELSADPGATVTVPVTVNNMFQLQSLVITYSFDPGVLAPLSSSFDGSVLTSTLYNREINFVDNNKVQLTFTAKSTFFMFTGSGVVGSVTFQAGDFGISPLVFTEFKVNTVTYLANTINGEVFISDCLNAVANAGPDASITSNMLYLLNGSASNQSSVEWATQGDGTFSNTGILNPVYTPGAGDIANGSVVLCLTAFGEPPCLDDTDCMTLSILPEPIPQAVMPSLEADPGSSVNVPVQANLLQGVQNLSLQFSFDPQVIEFIELSFTNSVLTSTLYNRSFSMPANNLLQIDFEAKTPFFTYTGSGKIADVEFLAGSFGISPLIITAFTVNGVSHLDNTINGQVYISDCVNATANAGADATICEDEDFQINGSASNFESFAWTTSGDGVFDDPTSLSPVYQPGELDILNGFAEICLIAYTSAPCLNDTSCITLTIAPLPDVAIADVDPLCEGDEILQLTGGVPEGGIYFIDGVEATSFNPEIAGNYELTYIYSDENGCTNSASTTIIVNPLPDVAIADVNPLCEGDEILQLTGGVPEGGTYFIDGVEATSFNPEIAGNYELTYIYSDENGCTNSASTTIIVNPLPDVAIADVNPLCEGDEILQLTGGMPEGGTYFIDGIEATVFIPEVPGNFELTYVYSDENGCTNSASTTIIVNPLPDVAIADVDPLCEGDEILQLTGGIPEGGAYFIDGIEATVFNPEVPGNFELTYFYSDENGCTNSASTIIIVNTNPEVICPNDFAVCINTEPFTLEGATPAGGEYSGIGFSEGIFDAAAAGLGTHLITYVYTDDNGCAGSCTFNIEVTPLPTVSAGDDATICADGSAYQLAGSVEDGGSFFWFTLMGTGDFDDPFSLNPVYTPGPTDYLIGQVELCLQATSLAPCADDVIDCMTLFFYPEVTVNCPDDFQVCINTEPFTLEGATPAGGEYSGIGVSEGVFDAAAAGLGTHLITYFYTDDNGCAGSCTFNIEVTPLPTVSAGDDATICADGSAYQLAGSVEDGGSFFWFTLMGTGDFDDPFSLNPVYTPGPTDYLIGQVELCLQATSLAPCADDVIDCMTLFFYPEVTVNCPDDFQVCINTEPFTLEGATPAGGEYSGIGVSEGVFDAAAAGLGTHLITYVFTDDNGCAGSCTFNIEVTPLPTVSAGPDLTIPHGTSTTITDATASGVEPLSYLWTPEEAFVDPTILNPTTVNLTNTDVYTLIVTDANGCVSSDQMQIIIVGGPLAVNPAADPDEICLDEPAQLFANASGGSESYTYLWTSVPAGFESNEADPVVSPEATTTYLLQVDDGFNTVTGEVTLIVNPLPVFDCPEYGPFCEGDDFVVFEGAGVYTFEGEVVTGFDPIAAGTFIFTYTETNAFGCSASCDFEIVVNPLPVFDCPEFGPFCEGDDFVVFEGAGVYTFEGEVVAGFDPTTAGTYLFTYTETNAFGCSASCDFEIVVNPLPVFDCPEYGPFCEGDDFVVFEGFGVYTFEGELVNGFDPTTAGTYLFTYTETNTFGCAASCEFEIVVNPLPVFDCPEYGPLCEGDDFVVFEGDGVYTFNGEVVTEFDPATAGTYQFTYTETNAFGCSASCDFEIVVNPLPVFDCPEYGPFCEGDDFVVFEGMGVYTFDGEVVSGFDPTTAGTYLFTYTETNTFGCSASCDFEIVVNPLPVFDCPEFGPFCEGDDFVVFEGFGVYTFEGELVNGFDPTTAGTYLFTYTETNTFGCSASCDFEIVVNPLPVFDCPEYGPLCEGDDFVVFEGFGVYTFEGEVVSGFDPTTAGTYLFTYTETNTFGCSASCDFEIVVNPLPVFDCPEYGPFCEGDDFVVFEGAGVYTFDGEIVTGFDPATAGTYLFTYTETNTFGCSASCDFEIVVLPTPVVSAGPDLTIPHGTSTTITDATASGVEPLSYLWSPEEAFVDPTILNPTTVNITNTDVYTLTVTDANGCVSSDQMQIIIVGGPLAVNPAADPDEICLGEPAQLFANASGGSESYTYLWTSVPVGFESNEADPVVSPEATTTYLLQVDDGFNTVTGEVTLIVNPLPVFDCPEFGPFCEGDDFVVFEGAGVYTFDGEAVTGFDPTTVGTFLFTYTETNAFGCSASCDFEIVVNPLPVFDCPEFGPFCEGDDFVVFEGSGVYTFEGEVVTGFDPTTAGTFLFTYTEANAFGCAASCDFEIVVNPLPVFDCPEFGPFCEGDDLVVFEGEGVYTFEGEVVAGFDPATAGTFIFTYTETNTFGCSASCDFEIVVNPLPVFDCPEFGPFCEGDDLVVFEGEGVYTFNGEIVNGFDPTTAGTYQFTYTETNAFGCAASCEFEIVVLPTPVVSAGPDLTIPHGTSTTITDATASGVEPLSYLWSPEEAFVDPTILNPTTVNLTNTDVYTLTVTDANGCVSSDQMQIIIVGGPLAVNPAADPDEICLDEPAQLFANASGGSESYTYLWTSVPAGFESNEADPVVSPEATTTYLLQVDDGFNTVTGEVTLIVNPLPVFDCPEFGPFCEGDDFVVFEGDGVYTFNGEVVTGFDPATAGTFIFTYTETNTFGCSASCDFEIVVNPLPVFDCPEFGPFCEGDDLVVFEGEGVYTFNGEIVNGFDPTTAGTYLFTYTETNAFGCSASCEFEIVVLPTPVVSAGPDLTIPHGTSTTITDATASGVEPLSYLWSPEEAFVDPTILNPTTVNLTNTDVYTLTVTDANGCVSSDQMQIIIVGGPLTVNPAADPDEICLGEPAQLFANASGGSESYTYLWTSVPAGFESNEADPVVSPEATTTYLLQVDDGFNTVTGEVTLIVNPLPVFDCPEYGPFCEGDDFVVFEGAGVYTFEGEVVTGFDPTTAGTYLFTYTETNAFGCSASCEFEIVVLPTPVVSAGPDLTIPHGTSTTITDATASGVEPLSYLWSPEEAFVDPTILNPTTVNLTNTDVYTLTVTDANGCVSSDQMQIIIVGGPLTVNPAADPDEICLGEPAQLFANASGGSESYTYLWTSVPAGFESNEADPVVSPEATTTYLLQVDDGFNTVTGEVTLIVNPLPVFDCPEYGPFCEGDDFVVFEGTGVYTFEGEIVTGFDPTTAGTFIFTYTETNTFGCAASCDFEIVVNPLPVFDCPEFGPFCEGDDFVVFEGEGVYTFEGEAVTGFDPTTAGTFLFTYTETNAFGCAASCDFEIVVNPLPVFDCPEYGPFCEGDDFVVFEGAGVYTFDGEVVTGFDPTTAGTFQFTYTETNAFGCSASCDYEIVVNPLPVFDCPEFGPFCEGDDFVVFEGTGVYTFEGEIVTGFDPTTAGTFIFTYTETNTFGCAASCDFEIVVNPLPVFDCPEFGPFCEDDDYVLFDGPGVYSLNGQVVLGFDPLIAGTYHFVYTETTEFGCEASCEFSIIVYQSPVIICENDFTVCSNSDPFKLTGGLPQGGVYTGIGVIDGFFYPEIAGIGTFEIIYTFTNQNGCIDICSTFITVAPPPEVICPPDFDICLNAAPLLLDLALPLGGLYSGNGVINGFFDPSIAGEGEHVITYIYSDSNGCLNDCNFSITVNPLPFVDAGVDIEIPHGGFVTIEAATASGNEPLSFYWTPEEAFIDNTVLNPTTVNLLFTDIYTLFVTDANGCENSDYITITIIGGELAANPVAQPDEICFGENVQLFANAGGGSTNYSYSWTSDPEGFVSSDANPTATPETTTVYTIEVNDGFNTVSASVTVVVNPLPVFDCPQYGPFCEGDTPVALEGSGVYTLDGVVVNSFDPAAAGEYTLVYTETTIDGCTDFCEFQIVVNPLPVFDCPEFGPLCEGDGFVVFEGDGVYTFEGEIVTGFDPATAGTSIFTYTETNAFGCSASCDFEIVVNPLPVFDCPEFGPFCEGDDFVVFEGAGVYTFNGEVVTGFDPIAAGNFIFTYTETSAFGCAASCDFEIVVNPLPVFDCPEFGPFCEGDDFVVFEGEGVYTFEGEAVTGFDPATAGTFLFTYTETNAFGCAASCDFEIVVNPLPVFDCPEYGPFCEGDDFVVFEGAGVYTFDGEIVTGFDPTTAGTFQFTYTETNAFGCSASCDYEIVVNPLPVFDCPEFGPFCEGDDFVVFEGAGVYTFEGEVVTGFDPTTAGTFLFTYTEANAFGCAASCDFEIVVNPLPVFDCPEFGPFCEGDDFVVFEGAGVYTFEGEVVTGFDPTTAGTFLFAYTETNAFGCAASCDFEIVVNPLPMFDCPEFGPFCEGDDFVVFEGEGVYTFEGELVTGFDPTTAGTFQFTYTETNAFGCSASCDFEIVVNPLPVFDCPEFGPFCEGDDFVVFEGAGVYTFNGEVVTGFDPIAAGNFIFTYTETSAFGCAASCDFEIVVNPLPVFDCPEFGPFCEGDDFVVFEGAGVYTFEGEIVTGFDPATAGTSIFTYTETNAFGCSASCDFEIVVNPLPVFDCPEFGPFCEGDDFVVFEGEGVYTFEGEAVTGFDPATAGTFLFTYTETNAFGCAASCDFEIVVNPLPVFDCPEYGPFCEGDDFVVFEGAGVYTFDGEIVTGFDPTTAGTFQFTYTETNAFGCSASCDYEIVVNPLPVFDCPEFGPFCEGDDFVVFEGTGVYTFEGEIVTGFDPTTAGTFQFTYTETNAFGCSASCDFEIVVNPLPVFDCPEFGPFCEGDDFVVFEGEGVYTFEGELVTGFDPTTAGTFQFTYTETNAFGCSASCDFEIVVNPLPVFDCPEFGPFCEGDDFVVFEGAGVYTFNGEVVTGFDPIAAGNFIFTYTETSAFGCAASCDFEIVVNPLPVFDCPEFGPFCEGDDFVVFEGAGVYTFEGEIVTGFDPATAGTSIFTYTETNAFGCSASCDFEIVVNPLPVFDCPEFGPFCEGDDFVVFEGEGVYTFEGEAVTGFDPATAGTFLFTYTETNAFGCAASCDFEIVVNPLPVFDCPEYGPFCEGDDFVVFEGAGVYTFDGEIVTGFDPTTAGTFQFTYTETNAFGCSASCDYEIVVNPLPVFDCPEFGPFCEGDDFVVFEGTGVYTFEGEIVTGFDPTTAGTFQFTYTETNAFGCSASCDFEIVVNPLPVFDCPEYGPFCEGDDFVVFEGAGVYTFDGEVVTGFDPTTAGTFQFTYTETNAFGCSASCDYEIVVNPLPVFDCPEFGPFCEGDDFVVFEGTGVYTFEGEIVTGFDPTTAGTFIFTYTETNTFGCAASCDFEIVVNPLPVFDCPEFGPFCEGDDFVVFEGEGVYTFEGEAVTGFDPATAGTFLFTYTETNAFGCAASCDFEIVVNPLPVFDCPEYGPFCEGDDFVVFEGAGVYTFDGEIVTGFDPTTAGTFQFTYTETNAFGCSASCDYEIVVNPLPVFDCPEFGPFCEGDDFVVFEGAGVYTFEGEVVTGFDPTTAGTFLFTYTEANAFGCAASCDFEIVVNPLPVFDCPEFGPFCEGDDFVVFEGAGVYTFEGEVVTGFDPTTAGTFLFAYTETNAFGCAASCDFEIVVNPLPMFDCPEFGPFCEGDDFVVFEGEGVYTFEGELVTGFDPTTAGTFQFTYTETNAFGCSASCDFEIVVNPLPVFDCPEYGPFCEGDDFVVFEGAGVYTFEGEIVTGFDPATAGTFQFTYTETNTFGCSASCEFEIVVNPLPVFDCPEFGPFCEGDGFVVFEGEGVYTFDGEVVSGFDPATAGTYLFTYTETNTFGCSASCDFEIVVNPLPVFDCPEFGPLCEGDDLVVFEGAGVYTFDGEVVTGFDPTTAGTFIFTYTETNAFGCSASCDFEIVVNPLPLAVCEDQEICKNADPIMFEPTEFETYTLDGVEIEIFDPADYQIGDYLIEYTINTAFGCMSNCSFVITVLPVPVITQQPESVSVIFGGDATFTISAEFAASFSWYGPGGFIFTEENVNESTLELFNINLSDQGAYYCEVSNDCATITSEIVTLEVLPWSQTIALPNYLTGVSTYLDLVDCDIETVLAQLGSDLRAFELINRVYVPGSNSFCWDEKQGAKLYLETNAWPTQLVVEGYPTLGPQMNIPQGWSIMPVWRQEAVSSTDLFEQLGGNLIIAISLTFTEAYWPDGNIFTLEQLIPGGAYLVKLNTAATVDWSLAGTVGNVLPPPDPENKTTWPDVAFSGNFHLISISTEVLNLLQEGDFIGVFDADGGIAGMVELESSTYNMLLRANGVDPMLERNSGLTNGSTMHFRVYRPSTGEEFDIQPDFCPEMPHANQFYTYGMSMIEGVYDDKASSVQNQLAAPVINIFPNPASDFIQIESDMMIKAVQVLSLTGQQLIASEINALQKQLDISHLNTGAYIVRLIMQDGNVLTTQLMVR